MVLCIIYGLRFICFFKFIETRIKHTRLVLGLGCAKDWATHSDFFLFQGLLAEKNDQIDFLFYSCTCGTGHVIEHIGFAPSFNSKYTGYVSRCQEFHQTTPRNVATIEVIH